MVNYLLKVDFYEKFWETDEFQVFLRHFIWDPCSGNYTFSDLWGYMTFFILKLLICASEQGKRKW